MNELAWEIFGIIAAIAAICLYFTAQKFKTENNPLADEIEQNLPKANCGACGKAGALMECCRGTVGFQTECGVSYVAPISC